MTKTSLILDFLVYSLKNNCSRTLRPIISSNASPSRITAAAGTRVSQGFFCRNKSFFFQAKRTLQAETLHHSRDITGSNFRSLSNALYWCLQERS